MKIFLKKKIISKKYIENLRGFTLSELLVVITLMFIISGAVYLSYNLSQKAYRESEITAEISQNGRVILERTVREIRQAQEIVTELPDEMTNAPEEIEFQDGHDVSSVYYIRYWRDNVQNTVKREEIAYYFSFSGDPDDPATYVTWNTLPPPGEVLATTSLNGPDIIGEYVMDLDFWGSGIINITLALEKKDKSIKMETGVFGRNF